MIWNSVKRWPGVALIFVTSLPAWWGLGETLTPMQAFQGVSLIGGAFVCGWILSSEWRITYHEYRRAQETNIALLHAFFSLYLGKKEEAWTHYARADKLIDEMEYEILREERKELKA